MPPLSYRRILIASIAGTFVIVLGVIAYFEGSMLYERGRMLYDEAMKPYRIARFVAEPADALQVPVVGVRARDIGDTYGEPRGTDRSHEGVDIFATRGTEIRPAVPGYVVRAGQNTLGGNVVVVLGRGGRGFYYAHLDSFGPDAVVGNLVATSSVIGYVGTTGNATGTPPHLHFGIYQQGGAIDPYPLLVGE